MSKSLSAVFKPDVSRLQIVEVGVSTAQIWIDHQPCDQEPFGRT
jgi:hypothetical protein